MVIKGMESIRVWKRCVEERRWNPRNLITTALLERVERVINLENEGSYLLQMGWSDLTVEIKKFGAIRWLPHVWKDGSKKIGRPLLEREGAITKRMRWIELKRITWRACGNHSQTRVNALQMPTLWISSQNRYKIVQQVMYKMCSQNNTTPVGEKATLWP